MSEILGFIPTIRKEIFKMTTSKFLGRKARRSVVSHYSAIFYFMACAKRSGSTSFEFVQNRVNTFYKQDKIVNHRRCEMLGGCI